MCKVKESEVTCLGSVHLLHQHIARGGGLIEIDEATDVLLERSLRIMRRIYPKSFSPDEKYNEAEDHQTENHNQ